MANIEVEVRSFVSKEQYDSLLDFFKREGQLLTEDSQETFYFSGEQDLRIQQNNFYAKVWLKKGKLHDAHREEIEIHVERKDFEVLGQLFLTLGYTVSIKWFRHRIEFSWEGVTVCLDHTKGYGYIVELEKMCTDSEKEREYAVLLQKLQSLGIALTPKEEFEAKFKYYKENWQRLVEE